LQNTTKIKQFFLQSSTTSTTWSRGGSCGHQGGHHGAHGKDNCQRGQGKSIASTENEDQESIVYCYICSKARHVARNYYYKKARLQTRSQ